MEHWGSTPKCHSAWTPRIIDLYVVRYQIDRLFMAWLNFLAVLRDRFTARNANLGGRIQLVSGTWTASMILHTGHKSGLGGTVPHCGVISVDGTQLHPFFVILFWHTKRKCSRTVLSSAAFCLVTVLTVETTVGIGYRRNMSCVCVCVCTFVYV